jgi:hypothetical protein
MIPARVAPILVDAMETEAYGPASANRTRDDGPTVPNRRQAYWDLRERNERRARVAKLNEDKPEPDPWIENAREVQSDLRHRLP